MVFLREATRQGAGMEVSTQHLAVPGAGETRNLRRLVQPGARLGAFCRFRQPHHQRGLVHGLLRFFGLSLVVDDSADPCHFYLSSTCRLAFTTKFRVFLESIHVSLIQKGYILLKVSHLG